MHTYFTDMAGCKLFEEEKKEEEENTPRRKLILRAPYLFLF